MDGKILLAFILFISSCTVFKKNPNKGNPPGTVQINDTLYIDETEVANIHWREYLYYLSSVEKDESKYITALPDTLVWRSLLRYCEPIVEFYFRHPAYNNFPLVGISYEQVIEFCKWRTMAANFNNYIDDNHIKNYKEHLKDSFPIKFYYRLPTKQEWEMIASGKISNQNDYGGRASYSKWRRKQTRSFNAKYPGDKTSDSIGLYTADIKSFFPNSYHAYNMIGNVAEMTSEQGIAKGGSFVHPLDSCKISVDQIYSSPQMWLGFRCVAVKIK